MAGEAPLAVTTVAVTDADDVGNPRFRRTERWGGFRGVGGSEEIEAEVRPMVGTGVGLREGSGGTIVEGEGDGTACSNVSTDGEAGGPGACPA